MIDQILFTTTFLITCIGGFGRRVASAVTRLASELEVPSCRVIYLDSDRGDIEAARAEEIAEVLHLNPEGDADFGDNRLDSILRFPGSFEDGEPFFDPFLDRFGKTISTLELGVGCATWPAFGDFVFRALDYPICRFVCENLDTSLASARRVQPIIVGSGGGGTSAPGILRLARLLGTDTGLARCSNQSSDRVLRPWVATLPPLIQSQLGDTRTFALRPLANANALTHELNLLAYKKVVKYVFRLNTQNGRGSSVVTLDAAALLLADVIISLVIGANASASRWCDTFDMVVGDPNRIGIRLR